MRTAAGYRLDLPVRGKVYGSGVDLTVLHIEDCPSTASLLQRVDDVLGDRAATVTTRVVTSMAEAVELGMHGSPTLLIEGRDPFAGSPEASLSCRLYLTDVGLRGLPSTAQLRVALSEPR